MQQVWVIYHSGTWRHNPLNPLNVPQRGGRCITSEGAQPGPGSLQQNVFREYNRLSTNGYDSWRNGEGGGPESSSRRGKKLCFREPILVKNHLHLPGRTNSEQRRLMQICTGRRKWNWVSVSWTEYLEFQSEKNRQRQSLACSMRFLIADLLLHAAPQKWKWRRPPNNLFSYLFCFALISWPCKCLNNSCTHPS